MHGSKQTPKGSKTAGGQSASKRVQFGSYRFARIELLAEEKVELRRRMDAGEPDEWSIDDFIRSGYSVKFSFDDSSSTVTCSVTASAVDHENAGYILTGKGRSAARSFSVVSFKHCFVVGNRTYREAEDQRGGGGLDIE